MAIWSVFGGITSAQGQSCSSCTGDSIFYSPHIRIIGQGKLKVTVGNVVTEYESSDPWMMPTPVEAPAILKEVKTDREKIHLDPDGFVSLTYEIIPARDANGDAEFFQAEAGCVTCGMGDGMLLQSHFWECLGWPANCSWTAYEFAPAHHVQQVRFRLRKDEDPANDPGASSAPAPHSSPNPPGPNEMPEIPTDVGQVFSLGRNGTAPVGRVAYKADLTAGSVSRSSFLAQLVPAHAGLVSSIPDPLNAALPKQFKSPQALMVLSDIVVGAASGVKLEYFDPAGAVLEPDGTYTPASAARAVFEVYPVSTSIGSTTVSGIKVVETRDGTIDTYEYYAEPQAAGQGGVWQEVRNGSKTTVVESPLFQVDGITYAGRMVETSIETLGAYSQKTEEYKLFPWGQEIVESIEDPNGSPRTTTYEYYESVGATSPYYGRLHLQHCSDGSWHRNVYDLATGDLKAVYRPWVDSPTSLTAIRALGENDCHALLYAKEFIFESEEPRVTVTEKILGTVTKCTVTTKISGMDFLTGLPVQESQVETRLKDGTLAGHQRSGFSGANRFFAGTLAYTVSSEGVLTHYDETSNLPPGPGETLARRQSIVSQGTLDQPQGVPRQQTRTITISNSEGLIERRTEVALGAGGFAMLEKETVERQAAAPQETRRIDGVVVGTRTRLSPTVEETTDEVGVVTSTETFPSGELKTVIRNGVRTEYYYSLPGFSAVYRHAGTIRPDPAHSDAEKSYTDGLGRVYYRVEKGYSRVTQFSHWESHAGRQEVEKDFLYQEIRTTTYFANGMLASLEGPGVVPEYHTYGVDPASGESWHKIAYGTPLSARWQTTVTDGAGRMVREMRPAPQGQGLAITSHTYNNKGQRVRTVQTGGTNAPTLYEYDAMGRPYRQGRDLNGNGVLDVHSQEPLSESLASYEQNEGYWWKVQRQRVYFEDGGPRFRETESRQRMGTGPNIRLEEIQSGIKSATQIAVNRTAKTRTTTISRSDASNQAVRTEVNGLLETETTMEAPTMAVRYYYDALERLYRIRPAGWSLEYIEYTYDSADRLVLEQNVPDTPGSGPTGNVINRATSYFDYSDGWMAGLVKKRFGTKGPNMTATETSYAYNQRGQVTHQWGTADYPLAFVYDDYGQMTELRTYRTSTPAAWLGSGSSTPPAAFGTAGALESVTTWHYENASGVLLEKEDAAGASVTYNYRPDGLVSQRTWSRGVTTNYTYDDLKRLAGQSYSDTTPAVSFSYYRDGSVKQVVDASGTRQFALNGQHGLPSSESIAATVGAGDLLAGLVLDRGYDAYARPNSVQVRNTGAFGSVGLLVPALSMSYESTQGKLGSVGSGDLVATYQYTQSSGFAAQRIITRGGSATTDRYDAVLGHISTIGMGGSWHRGKYYDTAAPGTMHVRGTSSQTPIWTYGFNDRGEVVSALRNQVDAPAAPYASVSNTASFPGNQLAGWSNTFTYDDIGNRTDATYGYDGAEAGTITYQTSSLNQYTSLTNASDLFVLGLATSSSAVKVKGVDTITRTTSSPWGPTPVDYNLPFRQGEYFSARLQANNASGPDWVPVTVEAGSVTQTGHLYHPPATEALTYDLDGNLTGDGRWTYVWDGENRLVSMSTTAAAVLAGVPDQRLTFAYDGQSRRVRKLVEHAIGVGSWQLDSDTRFIYDSWNLLAEVEMRNSATTGRAKDAPAGVDGPYVRRSYLWGPDVSGTMQGAGGVGGLLAVRRHARGTQGPVGYWAVWDLNGNVIGLQEDVRRSARKANYDYDPFGKPLRVSEPEEDLNPFRFSTKYTDVETGLCYYGYRYYDAVRGRWINRDPIEELGGNNLYCFVTNDPVNWIDMDGRQKASSGNTLHSQPSLSNRTGGRAGQDVTAAMNATIHDIRKTFSQDWGMWEKCRACNQLISALSLSENPFEGFPTLTNAWDIPTLRYKGGVPGGKGYGNISSGAQIWGNYTATYQGRVYAQYTINWLMFGTAMRLCYDYTRFFRMSLYLNPVWFLGPKPFSKTHGDILIYGYKTKQYLFEEHTLAPVDFDGTIAFFHAGWDGVPPVGGAVSGLEVNPAQFPSSPMTWIWNPVKSGIEGVK